MEKYYVVLTCVIIRTIGLLLGLCIADFGKSIIQCFQGEDFKMAIAVFDTTTISTSLYFALVVLFWGFNFISGLTVRKFPFLYGVCFGGFFLGTAVAIAIKKFQNSINVDTNWHYSNILTENPAITIVFASVMLYCILIFGGYGFNRIQLSSKFYQNFVKL